MRIWKLSWMRIDGKKFQKLINKVLKFNKDRGWAPMPVDLAKSIVIEAAELLEKFQWDESDKRHRVKVKERDWEEIGAELADVVWYIITFCNETGIDLVKVLNKKFKWNNKKYPKEKFTGKYSEKFYQSQKKKYRKQRNK